jgi:hypothetical protein
MAVQALDADLKTLKTPEAAQVFEGLRGRIMGEDSLLAIPPGIDGLGALVKAHPELQPNLLDFLESLPIDRCGAWPVSGWQGVITEATAVTRLNDLIEEWAASDKRSALKTAAMAARRVKIRSV